MSTAARATKGRAPSPPPEPYIIQAHILGDVYNLRDCWDDDACIQFLDEVRNALATMMPAISQLRNSRIRLPHRIRRGLRRPLDLKDAYKTLAIEEYVRCMLQEQPTGAAAVFESYMQTAKDVAVGIKTWLPLLNGKGLDALWGLNTPPFLSLRMRDGTDVPALVP